MTDRAIQGHMYIARRPCGKVSAMAWDEPKYIKDTAKSVADWIKRGDSVERITRYEGDQMPETICRKADNCQCRNVRAAAALSGEGGEG